MDICPNCHHPVAIRNPSGTCDHLYWPENLTPEARALVDEIAAAEAALEDYHENGGVSLDELLAMIETKH
jgi:hypothetical protein